LSLPTGQFVLSPLQFASHKIALQTHSGLCTQGTAGFHSSRDTHLLVQR
jgi:hypothetical protein